MKPISTFLTLSASLLASTSTASQSAGSRIYTFDTGREQTESASHGETLSAKTARLILAERLGSAQFSELGDVDEKVLGHLNKFGGAQQPILGGNGDGDVSKLLVVVEGVDKDVGPSLSKSSSGDFVVNGQEEVLQQSLVDNIFASKTSTRSSPCSYDFESDDITGTLAFNVLSTEDCPSKDTIFQKTGDKASLSNLKVSSWTGHSTTAVLKINSQSTEITPTLESTFPELASLSKDSNQESTVVLLPTTNTVTQPSTATKNKVTRRDASPQYSYISASPQPTSGADRPSTLLPVCHTSNSSCAEATNNCSGHGSCYKKYGSSDDESGDCYACKCERTIVRKNPDGTVKTVQWGGPACQKKDVSIPFWLLAGFTVLLVGAVTWAIGLLYSVGSEELPGVIGAGVSGPRAQK